MSETAMAEAFSRAKPANRPAIRKVSWSKRNRCITAYFEDQGLLGRRFTAGMAEGYRRVLLRESPTGSAVRIVGGAKSSNAVVVSMKTLPVPDDVPNGAWDTRIEPVTAGGGLAYTIELPTEASKELGLPAADDKRMPRPETLRDLLLGIRRIERETPYRLERAEDGTLEFVAKIR